MRSASPTAWAAAGVVGAGAVADEDRLDLGAELPEMGDAHRRPALEDLLAVGVRGRRQDRDARARPAGRGQQPASNSAIAGRNSPAPTSATGPGIGESLSERSLRDARERSTCDTGAGMTTRQRWTLVATVIGSGAVFLDGTIVNVALPRIGQRAAGVARRRPRGPDLRRQRLPGDPGRAADPGRRPVRPLRPAAGLRHRPRRVRRRPRRCAASRPTLELLVLFRLLQGAAGALLVPGSLALITQAFEGAERGRAFGIWAAVDVGADGPRADRRRARSSTRSAGGSRS